MGFIFGHRWVHQSTPSGRRISTCYSLQHLRTTASEHTHTHTQTPKASFTHTHTRARICTHTHAHTHRDTHAHTLRRTHSTARFTVPNSRPSCATCQQSSSLLDLLTP